MEKVAISKPGTKRLEAQRRNTFIRIAKSPKVSSEMGRAINCRIGRIKVLTTPITTAATIAAESEARRKPGTKYSTTRSAKTFIASLTISLINL